MESLGLSGGSPSTSKRCSRKPRRREILGYEGEHRTEASRGENEAAIATRGEEPALTCVFQEVLERALNGTEEPIHDYLIQIIHVSLPDVRCWVCKQEVLVFLEKKEDAFRHSGAEPVLRASHPQLRTDASEHTEGWETRQMDVAAGGAWPQCATSVKGCLVISKQLPANRKEMTEHEEV